jgi:hypothetical protein
VISVWLLREYFTPVQRTWGALGMSRRNFQRVCVRYEEDGIEALRDRRVGKMSPRRALQRERDVLFRYTDIQRIA